MGTPPDDYDGIIVTFAGIVRNQAIYATPPNGTWKLPRVGPIDYQKDFGVWRIAYQLNTTLMPLWGATVLAHYTSGNPSAFDQTHLWWSSDDPFSFANANQNPILPYSGGTAMVTFLTGMSASYSLQTLLTALALPTTGKVFAEQISFPTSGRGVRIARHFDGTCVHVRPVCAEFG